MDSASNLSPGAKPPVPGDWTICLACGAILRFDADLSHRLASDEEIEDFGKTQPVDLNLLLEAVTAIRRLKGLKKDWPTGTTLRPTE
jgi:hypothetical protein